jgi:hypothetical protein
LWIEILSQDDLMKDVWKKTSDLLQAGVPMVWIIDPTTLESELRTSDGIRQVVNKTLLVPGSPIEISLVDVMEELSSWSSASEGMRLICFQPITARYPWSGLSGCNAGVLAGVLRRGPDPPGVYCSLASSSAHRS